MFFPKFFSFSDFVMTSLGNHAIFTSNILGATSIPNFSKKPKRNYGLYYSEELKTIQIYRSFLH